MKTELKEAMTSGVFVEFRDAQGNTVGQGVFTGWRGRPLPAVGDTMCCTVQGAASGRQEKLCGRVVSRHFELQWDEEETCVWARLVLEARAPDAHGRCSARPRARFSAN